MNSLFYLLALLFAITQAAPVTPTAAPQSATPATPAAVTSLASVKQPATSDDSEKFDKAYHLYLAYQKASELFGAVNAGPWDKSTKDEENRNAMLAEWRDRGKEYHDFLLAAGFAGNYGNNNDIENRFKELEAKKEAENGEEDAVISDENGEDEVTSDENGAEGKTADSSPEAAASPADPSRPTLERTAGTIKLATGDAPAVPSPPIHRSRKGAVKNANGEVVFEKEDIQLQGAN
jgi:hypothetical protein